MFELLFGTFWLLITGTVTSAFAFSGAFSSGEMPVGFFVVFFGIFWAVGIGMLIKGIVKVSKNLATATMGTETYGIIIDIGETGCYINDMPQLYAEVMMITNEGHINRYSEVIGLKWDKYRIGDYLRIKHYKDDINILSGAHASEVPADILKILMEFQPKEQKPTNETQSSENAYDWYSPKTTTLNGEDVTKKKDNQVVIRINGVEYVRKN